MHKLRTGVILALAFVALTLPLAADTAYVPIAHSRATGDFTLRTELWVTNETDAIQGFTVLFLNAGSDGTIAALRDEDPTVQWVGPGQSLLFRSLVPADSRGMLELWGSPHLSFDAHLAIYDASGALTQNVAVPIITSENLVAGGESAVLQAMGRNGNGLVSNLGLANLGHEAITCSVSLVHKDGTPITSSAASLILQALSVWQFDDPFFTFFGMTDVEEGAKALYECDQPYWPYVSIIDEVQGFYRLASPSTGLAMSDLVRPVDDGGGGGGGGGGDEDFVYLSDLNWASAGGMLHGPRKDRAGYDHHGGPGSTPIGGYKSIELNNTVYPKGVFWVSDFGKNSSIVWNLNGQYTRFTALVRIEDEVRTRFEWCVMSGPNCVRLERPADGYWGRERPPNQIRVGGSGSVRIRGDGNELLFDSGELHAYGEPVLIDIDVTGQSTLRVEGDQDGWEEPIASYRAGLTQRQRVANRSWFEHWVLADAKLFIPAQ